MREGLRDVDGKGRVKGNLMNRDYRTDEGQNVGLSEGLNVGLTRRGLLVGAAGAAGALGMAAVGLAGCAPKTDEGGPSNASASNVAVGDITWDKETDVVVIGSGCGLAGAVKAAELGLEAIVLEKLELIGGSTNLHSGVLSCGGGTSLQREAGLTDSPEEFAKFLLACAKGQASEAVIRTLSKEIPQTFEWVVGLGVQFSTDWLYYTGPEEEPYCTAVTPAVKHGAQFPPPTPEESVTGHYIHEAVIAEADKLGVELMMETTGKRLLVGEKGEVIGVVAASGNSEITIKARKGIILAGGGMCNNSEMCAQYMRYGGGRIAAGGKGSTGDTIKMGMAVGADLVNMHESLSSLAAAVPLGTTTRGHERAAFPTIIVNVWGRRIVNEDYHSDTVGKIALGQDDGLTWQIFDSKSYPAVNERYKPAVIEAQTIDALASAAGISAAGLTATIERWNTYAANGEDPDYGKKGATVAPLDTPPYYAFPLQALSLVVQYGGLKIDENMQVIGTSGEPIARLYAAGIDAGNWLGRNYPGSGTAVGGGYAMARIGASKIAEYADWDA
jgi:succinate dehydrogenase/fumarate reductase flavoprotein subunit